MCSLLSSLVLSFCLSYILSQYFISNDFKDHNTNRTKESPNLLSMSETQRQDKSPSIFLLSYMKLQFFSRFRKFLQSKTTQKSTKSRNKVTIHKDAEEAVLEKESEDDSVVFQRSVKRLHFGSMAEKEKAAMEIEKIVKNDGSIRKLMAELGVIPALVGMVASDAATGRRVAIKALIELANGSFTNKALMVEAGTLSKLPKNVHVLEESTKQDFAELILQLSSLANAPLPITSSQTIPFLVEIIESSSNLDTKESCLGTLYNLSQLLENAGALVSNGVVQTLLKAAPVKELSEKALATLGHLVVTLMGKKAMEDSILVPECLIKIMRWEDKPKCQELSAYILMILAHQSSAQREKMAKSGIVQVLLEVALLGTPLAQKRAMKLLQWFKDFRNSRIGPHSGPQTGRLTMGSPVSPREAEESKKMMKNLVKQSLHKNMEMITRRANGGEESSKLKSLVISTSSKSLPY